MPDPPGPPKKTQHQLLIKVTRCTGNTRIYEEASFAIWHGGLVLDDGQTSLAGGGVEIIHRNFIIPATEVSIWVHHAEVGTGSPSEVRVDWILLATRSHVSEGCFWDHRSYTHR